MSTRMKPGPGSGRPNDAKERPDLQKTLEPHKPEPEGLAKQVDFEKEAKAIQSPRSIGEMELLATAQTLGERFDSVVEQIAIRRGFMEDDGQIPIARFMEIAQELISAGYMEKERELYGIDHFSAEEVLHELYASRFSDGFNAMMEEHALKIVADIHAKALIKRNLESLSAGSGLASTEEELLKAVSDILLPHSYSKELVSYARNPLDELCALCPLDSVKAAAKEKIREFDALDPSLPPWR